MRRGDTRRPHVTQNPEDPLSGKSRILVNLPGRGQRSGTAPPPLHPLNRYLDLVHVHDGLGGSLGAQPVAYPLIQGHPVQLAVVGRRPPEGGGSGRHTASRFARDARGFVIVGLPSLPVVPAVDGADKIGLHQAGVLLALPAPRGPACAARERKEQMEQR